MSTEGSGTLTTGRPAGSASPLTSWMTFPNPVNEIAARCVAGGVAITAAVAVIAGLPWLAVPLAYGFVARVLAGPRFSPWARIVTEVIVPRLGMAERPVSGSPKRFAQGIGAALTTIAAGAYLAFGATTVTLVLLAMVAVAATLEAVFAFCIGCKLFALLIRAHVLPERVCVACSDLTLRSPDR